MGLPQMANDENFVMTTSMILKWLLIMNTNIRFLSTLHLGLGFNELQTYTYAGESYKT